MKIIEKRLKKVFWVNSFLLKVENIYIGKEV